MKPSSILSIPALIALLPAIAALPTTTPHLAPLSSQGEIIPDKYIVVLKKGVEFGSIQAHLDVVQQAHSESVSGVWRFGDVSIRSSCCSSRDIIYRFLIIPLTRFYSTSPCLYTRLCLTLAAPLLARWHHQDLPTHHSLPTRLLRIRRTVLPGHLGLDQV
jgi:hypothetical protein